MAKKIDVSVQFWSIIAFVALSGVFVLFLLLTKRSEGVFRVPYYKTGVTKLPSDVHPSRDLRVVPVKVPILLYHYVEYVKDKRDTIRQSLDIIPAIFEKQIQTLLLANYTPITVRDLANYLDGLAPLPAKSVILTFDDGYGDFYTDVYPIILKYRIHAVIYVVPGFLDTLNFMTSQEVVEIAKSGLVEIASHTVHHVNLKAESETAAWREISDSKAMLEALIKRPVVDFAYPYGDFNDMSIALVKKAGYRTATSVVLGSIHSNQDRYFLYRIRPGARTGDELIHWIEGLEK